MIEKSINVSDENYFDNFDNPFEPSPLYSTNIPTHDDWTGPPWTEEPTDETASATDDDEEDDWAFFDTDDCPSEALPIAKMPDITPEEREICKELSRITGNNCDTTSDNNASGDAFDDDDMSLFDDNLPGDYTGGDSDTVSSAKSEKKKCPKYVVEVKDENGKVEKVYIDRNELLKHVLKNNKVMMIQNHANNLVMMYAYIEGRYVYLTDMSVERMVAKYITDYDLDLLKMADVFDVAKKLAIVAPEESFDKLNADESIINFRNGVYNIRTGILSPHSPSILSTIQIPCDYRPDLSKNLEKNAPVFCNYLDTLCSDDADVKKLICQYMAVAVSNIKGSRLKKAMVLYGPGDTGKSKVIELLQNLLGDDHCTVCDISDLEKRFTTSNLYGKRLAGCADMTFATVSEVKIFKNLTGGDRVYAEKKCKDGFNFRYDGLFLFAANNLPHFGGDKGNWVYDRFIVVPCDNVIPKGKQDRSLIDKMIAEKEAIISYLVSLLPEIIDNGFVFVNPQKCKDALKSFMSENSTALQFYDQFCEIRKSRPLTGDKITGKSIYDAYIQWVKDTNATKFPSKYKDFISEISNHIALDPNKMMQRNGSMRYLAITIKSDYIRNGQINITY